MPNKRKAKLTYDEMRERLAQGDSFAEVARAARVSRQYVWSILSDELIQIVLNIPLGLYDAMCQKIAHRDKPIRRKPITPHEWIIRAMALKARYKCDG